MPKPYAPNPVVTQNLSALMKARGINSQPALAAKSGVQQTTVGRVVRGVASPMADTLKLLADSLDCDMGLLYLPPEQFQELLESRRSMRFDLSALGGGSGIPGFAEISGSATLDDDVLIVHPFAPEVRTQVRAEFGVPVYGLHIRGDGGAPVLKSGQILVLREDGNLKPGDTAMFMLKNGVSMLKELLYEQPETYATASLKTGARATLDKSEIERVNIVAAVLPASSVLGRGAQ